MNKPLVSIIVPVFNTEKYIDRCLESVVNQSYTNLEILLMVGKTPDDSLNKCIEWQNKDYRIILVSRKDTGLGDARNYGMKLATGDYFAFIDSDDWVEQNYIEALVTPLIDSDDDVSVCGYKMLSDSGVIEEYKPFQGFSGYTDVEFWQYLRLIKGVVWIKMYRASFMRYNNITMFHACHEDDAMHLMLAAKVSKIFVTPQPLYNYYVDNAESLMHNDENRKDFTPAMQFAIGYLKRADCFQKYFANIRYFCMCRGVASEALMQYFPDYANFRSITCCEYGSFNLRWIIHALLPSKQQLQEHFCFTSLISQFLGGANEITARHENAFRQACIEADINKAFAKSFSIGNANDYIFIDFLEERYDIIKTYDGCYYTKSQAFDEARIDGLIDFDVIKFGSDEYMMLWKQACSEFAKQLTKQNKTKQIVFVRMPLAEKVGDLTTTKDYENKAAISNVNAILRTMENYFMGLSSEINVFEVPHDLAFTDADFRLGAEPQYLNWGAFASVAQAIGETINL